MSTTPPPERTAIYFISDLHLEAGRQDLVDGFESFLSSTQHDIAELYILGDFFEAWVGDDDRSGFAARVKNQLKALVDKGINVYFCHGNRDFIVGNGFARETGVTLLPEEHTIDLFGQPTLLLHGDQLCTDDVEYQAFRSKVRNPAWQQNMLRYPLWLRKLIAAYLRYRSRNAHKSKSMKIMDVNQESVVSMLENHRVTLMIHGHTHRPKVHTVCTRSGEATRVVLGDWGKLGWYYRVDQASAKLVSFPLPRL
ncbi:MAG: UDP-2,3-diacylglucosamine diphosphatase [Agarilytica sp.]